MVSVEKQIQYWKSSALEDWPVAEDLFNKGHVRHALFFAHLALEKILKAHVCEQLQDISPKTHNLVRLAELSERVFTQEQLDILSIMNLYNLQGRYPDSLGRIPSIPEANEIMVNAKRVYEWLMNL